MDLHSIFEQSLYGYQGVGLWQSGSGSVLWWSGIALLAAGLLLGLLWWIWRERDARLTAYELASKELERLKTWRPASKAEFRRWYFELIGVLKRYFAVRCGLTVADKTDVELVGVITKSFRADEVKLALEGILYASLGVRFADEAALVEQAGKDLVVAEKLVRVCEVEMQRREKPANA